MKIQKNNNGTTTIEASVYELQMIRFALRNASFYYRDEGRRLIKENKSISDGFFSKGNFVEDMARAIEKIQMSK